MGAEDEYEEHDDVFVGHDGWVVDIIIKL